MAAGRALLTGAALLAVSALTTQVANASQRFPAQGEIEVAFAPRDNTEKVLIELIRSARKSLKVHAYVFTMLSGVFIGLAQEGKTEKKVEKLKK